MLTLTAAGFQIHPNGGEAETTRSLILLAESISVGYAHSAAVEGEVLASTDEKL